MIPNHVFQTEAWRHIADHLRSELSRLREENDEHMPDDQTAAKRGEITALKRLLAEADSANKPPLPRDAPAIYDQ